MSLCPVILAGGGGTRLWPLSREFYPKQFLKLFGDNTLLQDTVLRLQGLEKNIEIMDPVFLCNDVHRFLLHEQIKELGRNYRSIILEPEGRNTAPALTVAAISLLEENLDPVIIMMPADHKINNIEKFHKIIVAGYETAMDDYLVTLGITPDRPETGYGYIKCGKEIDKKNDKPVLTLEGFTEKPDLDTAQQYIETNYLWNSGLFMMKASIWNDVVKKLQPGIHQSCYDAFKKGSINHEFYELDKESFLACKSDSIDYAVMEKLGMEPIAKTAVIPMDAGWSDVGAWSAVWELGEADANENIIHGDVIAIESSSNVIEANERLVTVLGTNNMVIIETADAVLVANKDKTQEIRKIVEQLKQGQREERLQHKRVYRPWGSYETIDQGEFFQAKRLRIDPGKKLSLQSHNHRAEHWVVVNGTATVTKDDQVFELHENESTYIPKNTKHRLENATDMPLEIIEVQSGSYLGEDDIIRYDDDFGRQGK